jgi:hypothetical protein
MVIKAPEENIQVSDDQLVTGLRMSGRLADAKVREWVAAHGGILVIDITQRPGG